MKSARSLILLLALTLSAQGSSGVIIEDGIITHAYGDYVGAPVTGRYTAIDRGILLGVLEGIPQDHRGWEAFYVFERIDLGERGTIFRGMTGDGELFEAYEQGGQLSIWVR